MPDDSADADPSSPTDGSEPAAATPVAPDLDAIEADLAGVEVALERLDSGEYWRDDVTGAPLAEEFLREHPVARHE